MPGRVQHHPYVVLRLELREPGAQGDGVLDRLRHRRHTDVEVGLHLLLALTGGGPGYATETLSTVLYEQAFIVGAYGYGTAIALVLTLIVACIAMIQLKVLRSQEVEA